MLIQFKAKADEQYDWSTGKPEVREGFKVPTIKSSHVRTPRAEQTSREIMALGNSKPNAGLKLPAYVFADTQGTTITLDKSGFMATVTIDTAAL